MMSHCSAEIWRKGFRPDILC